MPALSTEPMTDETSVPLDGEAWAVVPRDPMRPEWVEMTRGALGRLFEDKRFVVFNVPVDLVPLDSLDAAWREAEAALPERAGVALVMSGVDEARTTVDGRAVQPYSARLWAAGRILISREAASPAAALNALAAELRRHK